MLTTKGIALLLGVPALLAVVVQLAWGASVLVVSLGAIVAALGLIAFVSLGAYNAGAWLALFYVSGNVLVALYAKTMMRQPLNSHLYAPVASFAVLTISTAALLAALLLVRRVDIGRPVFRPTTNQRTLTWLSWGSFCLGISFWLLHQHFQDPTSSGFGGFAVFRDLLLMAVIARTALVLETSGYRRTFDVQLALVLSVGVFLGLLTNSKTYAAYPVVSYFATLVFYRRALAIRHLALATVAAGLFIAVLAPLIQGWRYLGEQSLPIAARVSMIDRSFRVSLAGNRLRRYTALADLQFRGGYYDYFGSNGRSQTLLGRYASVQQIDPVIARTNSQGTMGGSAIWPAI